METQRRKEPRPGRSRSGEGAHTSRDGLRLIEVYGEEGIFIISPPSLWSLIWGCGVGLIPDGMGFDSTPASEPPLAAPHLPLPFQATQRFEGDRGIDGNDKLLSFCLSLGSHISQAGMPMHRSHLSHAAACRVWTRSAGKGPRSRHLGSGNETKTTGAQVTVLNYAGPRLDGAAAKEPGRDLDDAAS